MEIALQPQHIICAPVQHLQRACDMLPDLKTFTCYQSQLPAMAIMSKPPASRMGGVAPKAKRTKRPS